MLTSLSYPISRVESVVDRAFVRVKRRMGWWQCLRVEPYTDLGRPDRFRVRGRVLDDKRTSHDAEHDLTRWESVLLTLRRFESDEVPGAIVRVTYGDTTLDVETNEDGYFDAAFEPLPAPDASEPWHEVSLELLDPVDDAPARATARVRLPSPDAEFVVVSDVDDTVLVTGATDKLRFTRTVLLSNSTTRTVFPGVGALYRALVGGTGGQPVQPIVYLSSSPNNLRRQFVGTIRHRGLPEGPLYLKDFGVDPGTFIKGGHHSHKLDHIEDVLAFYPDLPLVLFGDSGQEDPEIYQEAVRRHPERFRAVFVRDVAGETRAAAVDHIARDVRMRGVPMHRVDTTAEAARVAAEMGLIPQSAVAEVERECDRESAAS